MLVAGGGVQSSPDKLSPRTSTVGPSTQETVSLPDTDLTNIGILSEVLSGRVGQKENRFVNHFNAAIEPEKTIVSGIGLGRLSAVTRTFADIGQCKAESYTEKTNLSNDETVDLFNKKVSRAKLSAIVESLFNA